MAAARAGPLWIGVGAALLALAASFWADPGPGPAPDFVAKGHVAIESVLDALAWVDIRGVLGTGLLGPALLLILALAGTAFLPRDRGSSADAPPTAISAFERFAYAALIVLQLSIALYRLGVHPDMDFDEMSYTAAARMQLGEIPAGSVFGAHPFSRFQAQPLPLWAQSAGMAVFGPGLLAVRLVSVLLGILALVVACFSVRRRLGPWVPLAMAALCTTAPLWLASIRAGHYIAFSLLHSVLCFAALLRLLDRRDFGSAAMLGVLLGASLYGYQISWFVPLLALLAGGASVWLARGHAGPGAAIRTGVRPWIARAAVVVGVAGLTLLPGLILLEDGLLAVLAQTLDKSVWSAPGRGETRAWERPVLLVEDPGGTDASVREWIAHSRERGLDVTALPRDASRGLFHVTGPPRDVVVARDAAIQRGASVALDGSTRRGPMGQAGRMAAQLIAGPNLEFAVRVNDGPLIDPWVLPWVLVGAGLAWRRRREPVMVALLVWTVAGALLPAAIGGTVARRAVLMLPFAFALAAIPAVEIARGGRVGRLLIGGWITLALLSGAHSYFRHWHLDWRTLEAARSDSAPLVLEGQVASGSMLELSAVLAAQPDDRRVLLPRLFRFFPAYWEVVAEQPAPVAGARISERVSATRPEALIRISCGERLPLTWISRDDEAQRALFRSLGSDFEVEETDQGAYRSFQLSARRPGGCDPDGSSDS